MDWSKPIKVTNEEIVFGPYDINRYLPRYNEIPNKFKEYNHKSIALDIFYNGRKLTTVIPREGIDKEDAIRQIKAILSSFDPKHERKIAGVDYLISLFFEKFE
jgi:hypothetical protein